MAGRVPLEATVDDGRLGLLESGEDGQDLGVQLYRGIAGSSTFLNHAVWESTAAYRASRLDPEVRAAARDLYPTSLVASPHLFRPEAVPGICVA